MGPKSRQNAAEHDLFRMELVNLIDQRHELVKLAALIDWPAFEQAWGPKFESTTGRPALPTRLLISHTRGLPPSLKKLLKRRQAIEPTIGHMKTDGLLARNWLKGSDGDAIHAVLCGAGHNLRLILAHLRVLLLALLAMLLLGRIGVASSEQQLGTAV
jgi:hypothetical protein